MKKMIAIISFMLLTSVVFVVAESKAEDNNPLLLIYGRLGNILDKITELVNKDWDVTVEPNIIVQPPEVNVEVTPNITLPDKECKWESLMVRLSDELSNGQQAYFLFPPEFIQYKEVEIVNLTVSTSNDPTIMINNKICADGPAGVFVLYNANDCIGKIQLGLNEIRISYGALHTLVAEIKVKPANC